MSSVYQTLKNGAATVLRLDNTNVYCTLLFEAAANIAKDGMWMKLMNIYTLIVAMGDRRVVGFCITANGLTRAAFAVLAGNLVIGRLGTHTTMRIAGIAGIVGVVLNLFCFMEDSIADIYAINIVWAVFTGLSNSCLETIFAQSLLVEHREEVSTLRQSFNKGTTALGPLISLSLFYFYGNNWTLPILHSVLNIGTLLTLVAVGVCFLFDDRFETRQVVALCDLKRITLQPEGIIVTGPQEHMFANAQDTISIGSLTKYDLESHAEGPIVLTYPLPPTSKYARLKVLHKESLEPAEYLLGKQYLVRFKHLKRLQRHSVIYVTFNDATNPGPIKGTLENVTIFLAKGDAKKSVDLVRSKLTFMLTEDSMLYRPVTPTMFSVRKNLRRCCPRRFQANRIADMSQNSTPTRALDKKKKKKMKKRYAPNMWGANVIVCCDILNALGNGMSLKFMDLFLVQEYAYSPAALLTLQVFTNMAALYLTPCAKMFLQYVRSRNYHGKLGVIVLWSISMFFLAIIIIPSVPWWLAGLCIVMRNSLNTSTKAYNRAKLANYLPHDKVSKYMVWDSLNKANQGGIAVFGAQLVHIGGYRLCFFFTLCIMMVRMLLYLSFVVRQHYLRKEKRRLLDIESSQTLPFYKSSTVGDLDAARDRIRQEDVLWSSPNKVSRIVGITDEKKVPLLYTAKSEPNFLEENVIEEEVDDAASTKSSTTNEDEFDSETRLELDEIPSHLFRPSSGRSEDSPSEGNCSILPVESGEMTWASEISDTFVSDAAPSEEKINRISFKDDDNF